MTSTDSFTVPPTPTHDHLTETMTTITPDTMNTTDTTVASPAPAVRKNRVRSINVIRSEWIKFWTIRSTSITLIAAGLATVAFGMIFSAVADSEEQTGPAALLSDPVDIALGGIGLSEMIIGVLGVMFVAGEYSTGLIRTAFASVGKRSRVISAKVAVVGAGVFAVGLASVVGAVVFGQAVYAGDEATIALSEVWNVVFGTAFYLTGIALIGLALGFIFRSTAAGIGTLFGTVFIGPNLAQLLPDSITDVFLQYLPSEAGSAMMTRVSDPDLLSRGAGYAVFAAWVVGLLAVAGVMTARRDA